jgi:UDP-N-acetylmuramoylalanine--D-glutamate ligase
MKIAILGYGVEGQAAYEYWREGNEITICDLNTKLAAPSDTQTQLGEDYLAHLDRFDVIVRSPQIHPAAIRHANTAADVSAKITSNVNEFMRVCPTGNIIGVTGTKGKGTTSTLITKLLEATGKTVHLGGNIGIAALELLHQDIQAVDYVVLELSNFQLIDLQRSPHIAVCLMVEPEHLDWHEDIEEYIAAKQQLFIHQSETDIAIYYAANENSISIADASLGQQIPYGEQPGAYVESGVVMIASQQICQTSELQLLGQHNWQNVCAALTTVWQISQDTPAISSALTTFTGLPHRIEFVRELDMVRYYNDSFASGPPATQAAISAIPGTKVLILGGYDRMLPLEGLASFITMHANELRRVALIGASADRLAQALEVAGFNNYQLAPDAKTMTQVVALARSLAQAGDAVVLSPAFASFDMFKNFEDRGLQFKQVVNAL